MNSFIILHLSFCFLYLIITLIVKRNRDNIFYRMVIVFFIPILGFSYLFIKYIFQYMIKNQDTIESYERYIRKDKEPFLVKKVDLEKESNIAPIEDVLILNENKVKREFVIDILKDESIKYLNTLKKALEDEDTETSHYAASAITQIKGNFDIKLNEYKEKYDELKKNEEFLKGYAELVINYLESGFLDSRNHQKYEELLLKILEELLSLDISDEKYFSYKIKYELKQGNYSKAKEYCMKFYISHKNSENAYLAYMNYFYETGDFKNFNTMLQMLRNSPLKLSNKALNIVRFWCKG